MIFVMGGMYDICNGRYRISSNKRRGYYSFHGAQSAATIRGRPLNEGGVYTCHLSS